uniref:Murein endopeptidase K n=1 Tax=uncultured Desulfobacterium sp. TaxID=201089 RepID=E1YJC4_9BACT|nr:hypothetical protein N47_E48900 [uncultured Desulfobacterium sp.]
MPVFFLFIVLMGCFAPYSISAQTESSDINRYFYSGDGQLQLFSKKNGKSFSGRYRLGFGIYDESALKQICQVFDAPDSAPMTHLSLRLIEFIDFLQDRLGPGRQITITSGYRNPEYNTGLRNKGGLAAKASLHQYGMAADFMIEGVNSKFLWNYVKALGFGGAGYYHGKTVHIDVGPARSWDETTSGVGTGISDDNELICLVTDYDIYQPGTAISLRFIRMTAFPIGVSPEFSLIRIDNKALAKEATYFKPYFSISENGSCIQFSDIDQMSGIRWELPKDLSPGRYIIRAVFCDDAWKDMPKQVETPEIEIRE